MCENFTFEKLYTQGANLHPQMYPCANFHNNRTNIFPRIAETDGSRTPSMPLGQLYIEAAPGPSPRAARFLGPPLGCTKKHEIEKVKSIVL